MFSCSEHDDESEGHKVGVLDDYSSRHSSVLSLDDDRLSRSETPSPSLSNQRGSQHSGHDVSEDEPESRNSMILRRSPLMGRYCSRLTQYFQISASMSRNRICAREDVCFILRTFFSLNLLRFSSQKETIQQR